MYGVAFLCAIAAGTLLPLMNIVFGQFVNEFNAFAMDGADPTAFKRVLRKLTYAPNHSGDVYARSAPAYIDLDYGSSIYSSPNLFWSIHGPLELASEPSESPKP